MKFKLGDTDIPFVFRGDEMMYPNYIKDGLVLHYDFSGMTNADSTRGIATDLSGNGNHGELQNFNYTAESGYDKNKLLFDGVDDYIGSKNPVFSEGEYSWSVELVVSTNLKQSVNKVVSGIVGGIELRGYGISQEDKVRAFIFSNNSSLAYLYSTYRLDINRLYHIVFLYDAAERKNSIYINGTMDSYIEVADGQIFYDSSDRLEFSRDRKNNLYSTKVYNRPLTPEEIAHNYAIEKERFGIE